MTSTKDSALARAAQSVAAAAPRAAADPLRPAYHFAPPANWMNDPNGVIRRDGWWHLFYQHNPYGDEWGHIHWGHARSRDLVHWEHLPIALWPSQELGEEHCFSGCAAIDGQGRPILIYTMVGPGEQDSRPDFEQWAALGDSTWTEWEKHPANPMLSLETHDGPRFEGTWRDPFLFQADGRTLMALAAADAERANIVLYEAQDARLVNWSYRGVLYSRPRSERDFLECPNFVQLGGRWLLLTSPYAPVEYAVGRFNPHTLRFSVEHEGVLDPGMDGVPNFYATNLAFDEQGRCILFAWVRGFPPGRGWNGCLTLPRVLTLDAAGHPRQEPVPELAALRRRHVRAAPTAVESTFRVDEPFAHTLELKLELELGQADEVALILENARTGEPALAVRWDGRRLELNGSHAAHAGQVLDLRLFVDREVAELFAAGGRVCITRLLAAPAAELRAVLSARGGAARLAALDIWELSSLP